MGHSCHIFWIKFLKGGFFSDFSITLTIKKSRGCPLWDVGNILSGKKCKWFPLMEHSWHIVWQTFVRHSPYGPYLPRWLETIGKVLPLLDVSTTLVDKKLARDSSYGPYLPHCMSHIFQGVTSWCFVFHIGFQ